MKIIFRLFKVLSLGGGLKCTTLPNFLNKHVKLFVIL